MRTIGRARSGLVALALVCVSQAPLAAQLVPTSDEFPVNTHTTSSQFDATVATDAAGNFVVVWTSNFEDGDESAVVARRFDSTGTPLGTEFQVNSYTTGEQYLAEVAVAADGQFVVVWSSYGQDGSDLGVFAQRFNPSGAPIGSEFQVNTLTAYNQSHPVAEFDAAGNFVIAWTDEYGDSSYAGIFARRYDSSGAAQGSEFLVNTFAGNDQFAPDIAHTDAGFVLVWASRAGDLSAGTVYAQRFDDTGVPQGTEFQVNTHTTGSQAEPSIATGPDGNFVVVWSADSNHDGAGSGIFAQRFTSAATKIGSEFQVNAYTFGNQTRPQVTVAAAGNFVVAWQGPEPDGILDDIWARAFSSDGIADGTDARMNQFTLSFQGFPGVASTGERNFVALWSSPMQDGDLGGVYGRLLTQAGTPISGRKLFIRTPPGDPSGNKLTLISTDPSLELPQDVVDDPRCPPVGSGSITSGARLRVVGDGGNFSIDLPCVNWSANSTGTRFRYRDASGTSCRSVVLRAGKLLKASCKGPQVAYALTAPQGNIFVVLSTGDPATNHKYCATFGAQTSATILRDGSDGRSYSALQAGPGACP